MIYIKRTATRQIGKKRNAVYALGRADTLEGKDKALGGYEIWKLCENYDGSAPGGIRKTWRVAEVELAHSDAIRKINKLLGFKAFEL